MYYVIPGMVVQYANQRNPQINYPGKRATEMKILANREKKKKYTPVAPVTLLFSIQIPCF